MELVQLTEADLPLVMALQTRVAEALPDPRWYYTSTEAEFRRDMLLGRMLGIRHEGRLILMGSAIPAGPEVYVRYAEDVGEPWQHTLSFCDVMVDPAFRRQGLHSLLLARYLQWARETGMTAIYATVDPDNIPSRRSFEKAGYTAVTLQPAYDGRPRVYYRLNVSTHTDPGGKDHEL